MEFQLTILISIDHHVLRQVLNGTFALALLQVTYRMYVRTLHVIQKLRRFTVG